MAVDSASIYPLLHRRQKVWGGIAPATHDGPLSRGEIAAIVVSLGVFLVGMIIITFWLLRRRRRRRALEEEQRAELMKAANLDGVQRFRPASYQHHHDGHANTKSTSPERSPLV